MWESMPPPTLCRPAALVFFALLITSLFSLLCCHLAFPGKLTLQCDYNSLTIVLYTYFVLGRAATLIGRVGGEALQDRPDIYAVSKGFLNMQVMLDYWLLFGINLIVIVLLIAALYWRRKPNRNYALAMIVGGSLVYVVIKLLIQSEIGLGVGFGIFAVFSLLRFRTVAISLRDMTYLFATITLSLVNAMLMTFGTWEEVAAVNLAILATMSLLEFSRVMRNRVSFSLSYDNAELLHPGRRDELFADIFKRTGIKPVRIAINRMNIKNQSARLRVWHIEEDE